METVEVLPTKLYKFKLTKETHNHVLNLCDQIDWDRFDRRWHNVPSFGKSSPGSASSHTKPIWKPIVDEIEDAARQVKEAEKINMVSNFKVCGLWANRSLTNEWHHRHSHGWSFLSCICYIKGTNSGRTWFSRRNEYASRDPFPTMTEESENLDLIYKHEPEEGSLLIFPSILEHSVEGFKGDVRYTVSANLFADGMSGDPSTLRWAHLEVK